MTTNGSCRDFVMASEAKQSEILKKLEQIRKDIARKERKLQKLKRLSSHRSSVSSKPSDESHSSVADDASPVLQEVATLSEREICEASGSGTETAVTISSATSGANDYTRNSEPRLPRHHEDSSRSEATHLSDGKPTSSTNTPDCEPNPELPKTTLSPKPASLDASRASSRDVARPEQQSEIERIGRLLYSDSLTDSDRATRERRVDATDQALTDASKVRSPLKKKKRRSAGLDSTPCVSATGEYNLRKRKSLQSPAFVATKESRMILNAFSKLVQKASTFPVLPFESCQAELLSPMFQRKSSSGDEADASSQSPVAAAPKVDLGCRVRRRRRRSSMKVRSASPSTEDQEACSRQSNADFRVSRRQSFKVEVVECEAGQRNPVSRSLQQSHDATMLGIADDRSVAENACRKVGGGCSRSANSLSTVTAVNAEPILLSSSNPSLVEVKKEVVTCAEGHGTTPAAQSDSDKTDSSLSIATDHFVPPLLHSSKCIVKPECVGKKATLTLPVITPALEDQVERCPRFADGIVENHDWIFADFQNSCKPEATMLEKRCVDAQPSVLGRRESFNASDPFVPSYSKLESDDQLKELVNSVVQCLDVEDGSQDGFGFGRTSVSGGGRCSEGDSGAEEERVLSAAEALARLTDEAREADDTEDDVNGAEELVSMRESDEENGDESFCSTDCHTPCSPRGVIGDQNPLMFFCTLKCPLEEPVADVCFLDGTPRVLVAVQVHAIFMWHFAGVWHPSLAVTSLQYEIEDQHCFLRYEGSSFLVYLNSGAPSQLVCVQWDLDACQSSQLMLTCGSEYCTDPKGRLRIYLLTKLSDDCVATASRTSSGTSRIRVHRLRYVCGEVGDETEVVGRMSGTLHTLVGVDALPSALLGNQGNVFYVWDYKEKVLVKKMILEPNCFTDLHHICWASSDSGLLFLLMRTADEEACHLVVANPFTCKSQLVNSYAWRRGSNPAIQRHQQPQIQGHYMACISPDLGIRIWNLLGGNPVAEMRSKKASSVAVADFSEHCVVAVGMKHGTVLVFTS